MKEQRCLLLVLNRSCDEILGSYYYTTMKAAKAELSRRKALDLELDRRSVIVRL